MDGLSRSKAKDAPKKDMWSTMLDNVASGKRLPEKNVLVLGLGGTPESQKDFLEGLSTDTGIDRRSKKPPPVANRFALGYTYQDVWDADHEDTLARLSLYLLSEPSPAFAPLLRPLLRPKTLPDTLAVILLDWAEPWAWVRQLRSWISLLLSVTSSLDDETKEAMEEAMSEWRDRRRGGNALDGGGGTTTADPAVTIPLGPGEWDEELGIPLCVVCQYAEKIEVLEKDYGWQEEEFDFVQQFIRTILLKHGASLIYSTPAVTNSLQTLIHSSLGIYSLLKRHPLKHNVVDRDRVLVPPNWDSWGKIRIIREGFDLENVSAGWSVDIQPVCTQAPETGLSEQRPDSDSDSAQQQQQQQQPQVPEQSQAAIRMYEEVIQDPKRRGSLSGLSSDSQATSSNAIAITSKKSLAIEISSMSTQDFLASQVEKVEKLKEEDERENEKQRKMMAAISAARGEQPLKDEPIGPSVVEGAGRVNEHIGPVQFNMGGIQVDAEDMIRKLKERESTQTPERDLQQTSTTATPSVGSPESKAQNEALASFFAGLMKRGGGGGGSTSGTGRPGS
ncbi:MAG: hypothetical protein M1834_006588 [Cirrosporium novae-zelandiae]|nr:MAG: hypothetical protein M1834_006588 [Cirrosporium novae-zelandiae]